MEWTDSAKRELEEILDHLRSALDPNEVDVDEVTGDIQSRIETELSTGNGSIVTADSVRAASARIGVQEITPDKEKKSFVQALEKPRRIRTRLSTGLFWFAGIILPLLALGTELAVHLCLESGLPDPLPTPVHALLISLVPLANFLIWLAARRNNAGPARWLGFLLGAAIAVSGYYTLLFITITPFAIMGFAAVIVYGIGLLCFLPLSPLLSLFSLFHSRALIKRHLLPDGFRRIPLLRQGLLAGTAVIVLASMPMYLTKSGLTLAASSNPETQLKGIRLLRLAGDEVLMNRACYFGANMPTDPISWLINSGQRIRPKTARDIYYRVTGTAFNTVASPTLGLRNRRNPGDEFDWDPELGGDVVAGRIKGLAMSDSRIDGTMNPDTATAYLEWTMVFQNSWHSEREARAQIALPPGAVVSRLTLWIDGEEREAAFGGRSQVKQAYKKVVRRRRDPVLVTTSGPDRVLMQCYPVPANGEMKIRIGITAPLETPSATGRHLQLPCLHERNFRIPDHVNHAVWIENHMVKDLIDSALATTLIKSESTVSTCWAQDGEEAVLQEITSRIPERPGHLAVVIDSSASMKGHMDMIAEAVRQLPDDLPITVLVADDTVRQIQRGGIARIRTAGGKENSSAIRQALKLPGGKTCVVWIHGPQSWELNHGEGLRQALERQKNVKLIDYQVSHGPHRLVEKLENLANHDTVRRSGDPAHDLKSLFTALSGNSPVWRAERSRIANGDPSVRQADGHLARLHALDRIRADLTDGIPGNELALELALKYHLVTPVSGAVVLETQQQFKEAGLEPVDSSLVPGVPEPGVLTLLIFAILLVYFGRRMILRLRTALGY